MKQVLYSFLLIAFFYTLSSHASPLYYCVVGNTCSYTVFGFDVLDFNVDITNILPNKHYTCSFKVSGSNSDKIYINNLYAKPNSVEVNLQPLAVPANASKLFIDTHAVAQNSDVFFDFHSARYFWQSNQVSVACYDDHFYHQ